MSQLSASNFTAYSSVDYTTITAGPEALYSVSVDSLLPTQQNEGFTEVDKKADGFDDLTPSQLQANLLTDIEPVVIGPGGKLYLTDGHHTFTALEDSVYGASNPTVYVNVIANYSNLTESQFFATMQTNNLLLPLNDNVAETVNDATGAPIPTSLTGLTSDVYRGLEYSILKNKSSKLFTTSSNLTGQTGASIPGLDKMTGFYSDFLEAAAYQDANGGLGLPYLSPGDVALATQWNLTGSDLTTLPNVSGSVHVYQLPGYILAASLTESSFAPGGISNTTLASGALDGNGTFTGITQINAGTTANPIYIGTPNTGFIMQLGNDNKGTVTLTSGNTYTGGTSILAGTLIITDDSSLGAAAPANATIDPNNVKTSVQADNGIVFNSLSEGNGTLQIGTTSGNGTASFSTSRPIAVGSEAANINLNGYLVTLNGEIASLGTNDIGIGSATGYSDLTVEDTSSGAKGVLILPASANNADFYGNWIITTGTLRASSDASLGNTTGPSYTIGQIVLNGGTFQAGASFSSVRTVSVQSKSTFDTAGYTTSFAGALSDSQRNLTITNSGSGAGAVSFGSFQIGSALELTVSKGSGTSTAVTFTSGIQQSAASDQLLLKGLSSTATIADASVPTFTNGIVAPWIVVDSGATTNPYDFATYGTTGFTTFTGYATNLATATSTSVVKQSSIVSLSANTQAYALNIQSGVNVTIGTGKTLTLGNGANAGLILNDGASSGLTGGTLAFGTAEADVTVTGSAGNTITSAITGSGGLNIDGTGTLTLSTASTESGLVTVNSGTLALTGTNIFSADTQGVLLQDTRNLAAANLTVSASNQFAALNSAGNNSTVTISSGAVLTIGDATNQSSTLSSTITETGTVTAGALTKAGTGLLDISGSGGVTLVSGSTVSVAGGALRIGNGIFSTSATNAINLATGTELQYEGNGGSKFNDPITGQGTFHLLAGTVQLTSTGNTYTGGTVIESGATLDVTTANLPTGGAITNAGGVLDFDQTTNGTFTGVMSDGLEAGGPNDPDAIAATAYGPSLSGTLIKDDSTGANSGNVTIGAVQTFTGATYIEAGTLTLGVANAIATSSGVTLGRVGTSTTATLALTANNTLASLSSDASSASVVETTSVNLNSYALTIDPGTGIAATFAGTISGTGGSLIEAGTGTETLTGTNSFTGGITLKSGTLELGSNAAAGSGAITFNGSSAELKLDASSASFADTITTFAIGDKIDLAGLTYQAGTTSASTVGSTLSVTNGTSTETFTLSNLVGGTTFSVTSDGNGGALVTGVAPYGLTDGGNGGAGDYGYAGGLGGSYLNPGSAGFGAKTYQQKTGSGGGGGGAGAAGGAGGIGGVGEGAGAGGAAGQAGVNAYGTGIGGGQVGGAGSPGFSAGGGGGGGGGAYGASGASAANTGTLTGGAGGAGGAGGYDVFQYSTVSAGGGGGGAGGFGLIITGSGTSSSNAASITGGAGGAGGAGDVGGNGGGGGVGVYFTYGGSLTNSGAITGGAGGAAGAELSDTYAQYDDGGTRSAPGLAGAGGAGVVGTGITLIDSGAIFGGLAGDGTTQADAIVFAGGANVLTLQSGWSLAGAIDVTGSVTFNQSINVTLSNVITGTGSVIQDGSGTLTLTGADTYSGGTTIDTGTLEIGAGASAGSGAITFAGTAAELELDATQASFADTLTGLQAGDKVDLAGLAYVAGASASLSGSTLSVTSGAASEQLSVSGLQTNNIAVTSDGHGGTLLTFGAPATPSAPTDSSDQNGYVNAASDTSAQTLSGVALAGSTVTIYNEGLAVASFGSNPSTGAWSYNLGQLPDGQYSYTVSASNAYGASAQSPALSFTVATQAPSAGAMESVAGVTPQTSDTITVSAAAESVGDNSIASVEIDDNGVAIGAATLSNGTSSNGTWTYTASDLTLGAHNFTAVVTDTAGNAATVSAGAQLTVVNPPGTYLPPGTSTPITDPVGTYSAVGASAPTPADPGTYIPVTGATSAAAEVIDPAGTYSAAGASAPTNAPAGTYIPTTGATSAAAALTDPAGTYSGAGATAPTTDPAGTYSPAGASAPITDPAGTYSVAGAVIYTTDPAGTYSAAGASAPITDPVGTYSLAGASAPTQAPPGTYIATTGASAPTIDPAGTFTSNPGSTAAQLDTIGYYSGPGASAATQASAGYYVGTAGSSAETIDPVGTYSGPGASAATQADPGYYVGTTGASTETLDPVGTYSGPGASAAIQADPGYYVGTAGASTETIDPVGTYSLAGASAPTQASPGYYVGTTGASSEMLDPAGTYTSVIGASAPLVDPAGTYSGPGASAPALAPAGSYIPTAGATSAAAEILASPGYYVPYAGASAETPVDPGYYQPNYGATSEILALAPTITGAVANQATTSEAAIDPFAHVTIGDPNIQTMDVLTITVSGSGGTLKGSGLNGGMGGVYTITGTAASITTALDALVFKPTTGLPNTTPTTTFTLSDTSSVYATATVNSTTSVIDSDPAVAPTISGTKAGQMTGVQVTDKPFAGVTIADPNSGTTDTAIILIQGGGSLSGTGLTASTQAAGLYTVSAATLVNLNTEIDNLVYTPAASATHAVQTVDFELVDVTSAGTSVTDTTTTLTVDPGPSAAAVSSSLQVGTAVNLTSQILAAATPGIKGDTLTISADNTNGTLGMLTLVNGQLVYSATTAALSHIAANGTQGDSFAYTITDEYGDTATGTVKITVTNPATTVTGSPYGSSTIQGSSGTDIINASGWYNTIYANGGNDVINTGFGNASVYVGTGDVVVNLQGYYDSVSGGSGTGAGNGNDSITGSGGNASVTLGNGNDTVSTGGYYNTISLGNGNDSVNAGQGNATVALGNGTDSVTIGGYGNTITAGNGNDKVTGGQGTGTITLGNGNDSVSTSGYSNIIKVGSGTNTITDTNGGSTTVMAGAGTDTIALSGDNNNVTLNGTNATVSGGQGADSVTVNSGTDKLTFAGWNSQVMLNGVTNASITDQADALRVIIGSSTQTDTVAGFATSDPYAVLDLKNGAGGYASVNAIVQALHSDGHGGTMLSLGSSGSIDFQNTSISQLTPSHFAVG